MAISKVIYKSSAEDTGTVWMDTTDKTVTAGSMLNGITALKNDGTTATGNIASKTSSDLTANNLTVTAPAGYYASAASKTLSDQNLVAGNVKKDVTIFGTTGTYEGAGGDTYTRTVIVPQQTVSGQQPTLTHTEVLVAGEYYIATIDGTEYLTTASSQWYGGAVVIGDLSWYYGTPGEYDYPFAIGYAPGDGTIDCAMGGGSHTVKVEHLEFVDGPLNLIEKSITANGTYNASSDSADGYSSVTVNVSGGGGAEEKDVNFIDYDGTIVASYTKADFANLSALPANPSHTGLTAQGWNWTVAQLKAQLLAMPDDPVTVGQMYITSNGKTEIDVSMPEGRLSPILTIAVNGTITVDWGDNTTADTVTGSSLTTRQAVSHTYASAGDYTISISVTSGNFDFYGSSSYLLLRKNTTANQNRIYANCINSVRLGSGITGIGQYAFYYCTSLTSITIPSSVTSIGNNAFGNCYSLDSITIPSSVTSIENNTFSACYSLDSITIPSNVTSIGNSAFSTCYSLTSITIPSNVTSIGSSAFSGCYTLDSITIPSNVTSIGESAFYYCYSLASITIPSNVTSIGNSAFNNCYSLASITIPSNVTSIGNSAFQYCYGMAEYHVTPTTVPTLGTTVFSSIVSDCVIYVPSAKLTDYKGATNWSTYASYMQGE